ncbi:transposase family protein, partial [Streptomyces sp. NPDC048362]|uniref:helix-turn-helix domain-containing protein n=1 Tax=Streptomyces sp. NPDC048362 TaxID=3365539 RepID=UPI00371FEA82
GDGFLGRKPIYQGLHPSVRPTAQPARQVGKRSVHAELDPGTYDTGIKVTDSDIDALPMHRHRFHGDWNYTLQPQPTTSVAKNPRPTGSPSPQPCSGCLRSPELTGMPEPVLDKLVDQLTVQLDELREQRRRQKRGGERIRARGAGAKDKLTIADRVLATVLYLRKLGTRDLLAQLFGVNGSTITRAVRQVQPLLAEGRLHHSTLDSQVPVAR